MHRKNIFTILLACLWFANISGQTIDSVSVRLITRLSFYSYEKNGELLLHLPSSLLQKELNVIVNAGTDTITIWKGISARKIVRIPFNITSGSSTCNIAATLTDHKKTYTAKCCLTILPYKPNEVKTDRLTGGLIVNKLPFFPFGFYCYSPVPSDLPGDEIIRGFNMISPYQKILPETLSERKAYMDRCAQLGMKVHYNLLSVSGGGGVGSRIEGLDQDGKKARLLSEIAMFRDHPALLGWYIADEPNGYKIPAEELEAIYKVVRENDPWHPVSVVFMAPFTAAEKYEDALDIVMADPYPIPELPVTMVGNVAQQLRERFTGRRPVWIVPQAFGGGEIWSREPTAQEIRSMTWQSIINGATGIQYFVRQGPNYFPKSPAAWAECGKIATEVAEITPWLLSEEETKPVSSSSANTVVMSRMHDGKLAVIIANKINEPVSTTINMPGVAARTARSLFENRILKVNNGSFSDYIPPFGSQVYLINTSTANSNITISRNLLADPGFEDLSSPGMPSACYARPGGDPGATYFLDSRQHFEGDHSLRLVTPEKDKSVAIRFFPVKIKPGASYVISIMAKADPEQRFGTQPSEDSHKIKILEPQYVEVTFGDFSRSYFVPGKEWKQFVTFVTIPADTIPRSMANLILRMPGQGVAWFDQVRILEDE